MEETATIISISDVLEYSFCPRFIFYMHCLCIPQHEEQRYKVLRGREVHEMKLRTNPDYLRKRLHVTGKERNVFLSSRQHHIKGVVDEVLFLEDGSAAPFEYKFAEFRERLFLTYKNQLALQAIMICENYHREVNRGYICFTRSNNRGRKCCLPGEISTGLCRSCMISLRLSIKDIILKLKSQRINASTAVTGRSVFEILVFIWGSINFQQEL